MKKSSFDRFRFESSLQELSEQECLASGGGFSIFNNHVDGEFALKCLVGLVGTLGIMALGTKYLLRCEYFIQQLDIYVPSRPKVGTFEIINGVVKDVKENSDVLPGADYRKEDSGFLSVLRDVLIQRGQSNLMFAGAPTKSLQYAVKRRLPKEVTFERFLSGNEVRNLYGKDYKGLSNAQIRLAYRESSKKWGKAKFFEEGDPSWLPEFSPFRVCRVTANEKRLGAIACFQNSPVVRSQHTTKDLANLGMHGLYLHLNFNKGPYALPEKPPALNLKRIYSDVPDNEEQAGIDDFHAKYGAFQESLKFYGIRYVPFSKLGAKDSTLHKRLTTEEKIEIDLYPWLKPFYGLRALLRWGYFNGARKRNKIVRKKLEVIGRISNEYHIQKKEKIHQNYKKYYGKSRVPRGGQLPCKILALGARETGLRMTELKKYQYHKNKEGAICRTEMKINLEKLKSMKAYESKIH